MSEAEVPKPQCGGGSTAGQEYDLAIHTVGLFLVLAASTFGAGFPVVAKKVPQLKIPPNVFFFCKHFGTGVLIATAFVHLLPTAFQSLNNPCLPDLFTERYPALPGVIMMASLFVLFVIEMWLHSKTGGHSHGGATGADIIPRGQAIPMPPPSVPMRPGRYSARPVRYSARYSFNPADPANPPKPPVSSRYSTQYPADVKREIKWDEKTVVREEEDIEYDNVKSDMPAWFVVFYEKYVRQREEMRDMISTMTPKRFSRAPKPAGQDRRATMQDSEVSRFSSYDQRTLKELEANDPDYVDPMVLKKMSLQITLIEGGILFHSVFVGMTVSITIDGFIILLIAILFHQLFEGLGLGSRIAAVPYPKGSWKPWILVLAFGTTAPFGQAIGILTRNTYDPDSAFGLIIVGVFNAISSGLLIYAALVDLLAQDFLSEESDAEMRGSKKTWAFIYVLLGAAGMAFVGAFA